MKQWIAFSAIVLKDMRTYYLKQQLGNYLPPCLDGHVFHQIRQQP